jgi:hypothetical protein
MLLSKVAATALLELDPHGVTANTGKEIGRAWGGLRAGMGGVPDERDFLLGVAFAVL